MGKVGCTYEDTGSGPFLWACYVSGTNVYFGSKLVESNGALVATDRMGSVRANSNGDGMKYFPYGQERTAMSNGREKFATYFRDSATQDYAEQRYYGVGTGRFLTADPGGIRTVDPSNGGSWKRYAYVVGDPINKFDPAGREDVDIDSGEGGFFNTGPSGDGGFGGGGGGDGAGDNADNADSDCAADTCITVTDTADPVPLDPDEDTTVYNTDTTFSTTVTETSANNPPCVGGMQDVTTAQGQQIISNASNYIGTPYKTPKTPNGLVCTGLACKAIRPLNPKFPEGPANGWGNHPGLRPLRPGEPPQAGDVIRYPGHVGFIDPRKGKKPVISATTHGGVMWTPVDYFGVPVLGYSRVQIPCN